MLSNCRAVAFLVCVCCSPLLRPSAAVAGTYQSPGHSFTLTLPDGWRLVDPVTFENLKAAALAQGKQAEFIEAVYQGWEKGAARPVVLAIGYHEYPNESLAELAATADKEMIAVQDRIKLQERYSLHSRDGITEVDSSYPTVTDTKRRLVRAESVLEYRNKVRLHALTFYKPGREGVVHLAFDALQSDYRAQEATFDHIANSIVFAPGHEFQPGAQKANLAQADSRNDFRTCGLAFVSFLCFAGMVFAAAWARHRSG
jgi:hypothetical protein